jgi:hypothetical protein
LSQTAMVAPLRAANGNNWRNATSRSFWSAHDLAGAKRRHA